MSLLDHYLQVFRQVLLIVGQPEKFNDYSSIRETCIELLENAEKATGNLQLTPAEKEAAKLAVVAWIDEQILCSTLTWRQQWQGEPLQLKYFNITIAGERFFELMDKLEPEDNNVREVFLFCLQHGFHGRFSRQSDQNLLQETIQQQRHFCLPPSWQAWPNDEPIVPVSFRAKPLVTHRLNPLLITTAGFLVVYLLLYFLLSTVVG